MKTFLCSLLLAAGILAAAMTDVQAQPCGWTFRSSIDCSITFQVFLTCPPNGPVPVSTLNASSAGCWGMPTSVPFTVNQCSPPIGCTYSVTLNGMPYTNGSIFCCDPDVPPENCSKCNCAYVNIDLASRTISLTPACKGTIGGTSWDCCDLFDL